MSPVNVFAIAIETAVCPGFCGSEDSRMHRRLLTCVVKYLDVRQAVGEHDIVEHDESEEDGCNQNTEEPVFHGTPPGSIQAVDKRFVGVSADGYAATGGEDHDASGGRSVDGDDSGLGDCDDTPGIEAQEGDEFFAAREDLFFGFRDLQSFLDIADESGEIGF